MSFKDAWNEPEESVINKYEKPIKKEPEIKHNRNQYENREVKPHNQKFAPFAEIEHHNGSDD